MGEKQGAQGIIKAKGHSAEQIQMGQDSGNRMHSEFSDLETLGNLGKKHYCEVLREVNY